MDTNLIVKEQSNNYYYLSSFIIGTTIFEFIAIIILTVTPYFVFINILSNPIFKSFVFNIIKILPILMILTILSSMMLSSFFIDPFIPSQLFPIFFIFFFIGSNLFTDFDKESIFQKICSRINPLQLTSILFINLSLKKEKDKGINSMSKEKLKEMERDFGKYLNYFLELKKAIIWTILLLIIQLILCYYFYLWKIKYLIKRIR